MGDVKGALDAVLVGRLELQRILPVQEDVPGLLNWTNYESTGGGVTFGVPACLLYFPTFFRRICSKFREKMQIFLEIH